MWASKKSWFGALFGFEEREFDYSGVKANFIFDREAGTLTSRVNGEKYRVGTFSTPSLGELRDAEAAAQVPDKPPRRLRLTVVNGDVSKMQADRANEHAVFQAASQFNCLEFVGPRVTPERGVTGYASDHTQGPACSISAGPATVVRNYFAEVTGGDLPPQEGQTADRMINNLADFAAASGNADGRYWKIVGGYTMTPDCPSTLAEYNEVIKDIPEDTLLKTLRIGVHRDVEVTSHSWGKTLVEKPRHVITQVFASATAAGYNHDSRGDWAPLSQLVLKASYEATLAVALEQGRRHGWQGAAGTVYLTFLGGGVFGNAQSWIDDAIDAACAKYADEPLDVRIVQYSGAPSEQIQDLMKKYAA